MATLIKKLYDYKLRAGDNLEVPIMITPVAHGAATRNTTYSYRATFKTIVGETTPTEVVTCVAAATLNTTNYVALAVDSVPAGATHVRYYKESGGVYYLLQEVTAAVKIYSDKGIALSTTSIVPATNDSGRPGWQAILFQHGRYLQRQVNPLNN